MENANNSRWWETYLVRYITGAVVGAVIVYQILLVSDISLASHPFPKWFELKTETLILLGAIGFAYCYIASAPITFLHAIRVGGEGAARARVLVPIVLIVSVPVLLMFLMEKFSEHIVIGSVILYLFLSACWIAIGLRVFGFPGWEKSYECLVDARSKQLEKSTEFVDTYRHLREHGNAFYIVLMELVLAMPLYIFAHSKNWVLFVVTVGLWLIPGAICWYLGNALEKYMADKYCKQSSPVEKVNNRQRTKQ